MVLIISLVVVGILLLVAEIVLLPGTTVAGFFSLLAFVGAAWTGFSHYGTAGGLIVSAAIAVLAAVAVYYSLKAKTWQRFALERKIDGVSLPDPSTTVKVGDRGVTVTRLAPMGRVRIGDETYEAKTPDAYVDPRREVEVTGFDNSCVVVKSIN